MPLDHATEFALSFTADAVHLLRRGADAEGQAWQSLGSADFASVSFRADLAALRSRAADPDLHGDGLPVVVLIPQDQILYTSLSVPLGPERDVAVGQALDGLTPYDIEELAYDWTDEGADVRVAAVARQTLIEAREFAERHGFASFGYSALPEGGEYPGMPVFGIKDEASDGAADATSLDLDADLPDEFADEAGFRPRDELIADELAADELAADELIAKDDVAAEEVTDVAFTELSSGADDADQQPVLDGLDLPQGDAGAPDGPTVDAPTPDVAVSAAEIAAQDQSDLFAEAQIEKDDDSTLIATGADSVAQDLPDAAAEPEAAEPEAAEPEAAEPEAVDSAPVDVAPVDVAESDLAPVDEMTAPPAAASDAVPAQQPVESDATVDEPTDPTPLAQTAPDDREGADQPPEPAAEPDLSPEDDEQTEAERAALDAAAAELAAAELAAAATVAKTRPRAEPPLRGAAGGAATGPTVVRHAPLPGAKGKARVKPDAPHPAGPAAVAKGAKRGGLVELIAMLGALIVGLLLVWAFIVPRDTQTAIPELAEIPAPADVTPTETAETAPAIDQPQQTAQSSAEVIGAETPATDMPAIGSAATGDPATGSGATEISAAATGPALEQPLAQADPGTVTVPATTDTDPQAATIADSGANPTATQNPVQNSVADPVAVSALSPEERALAVALATSAADMVARPPAPRPQVTRPQVTQSTSTETQAPASTAQSTQQPADAAPRASTPRLSSSARPVSAPRRQASAPAADTPPAVPDNPLPLDTVQRQTPRPSGARPPRAPRAAAPAPTPAAAPARAAPAPAPAAQQAAPSASNLRSSSRPPSRPEGAIPDVVIEELTPAEKSHIDQFLQDLRRAERRDGDLRDVQAGVEYRVAENRPQRRPSNAGSAAQAAGVESAVRSAVTADPPSSRPGAAASPPSASAASTMPARDSGGLLRSSNRPRGKPAGRAAAAPPASDAAVTQAIAEAVNASTATPGAVALTALSSSDLPPRRSGASRSSAAAAPDAPAAAAAAQPESGGPSEAQQAERRRLDEQLQSQAEARIRARAQADAAAEAQARAQAEARARAQVAAEERAAAARRQTYKPQELDDEPEIAQAVQSGGATAASVAAAATQRRGIDLGRTTIIGIVGAGQASRALIRLRNGKIVTVRLGDRIDGGTINSIGGGKLTYVKNGRQQELRMLDGR